MKNRGVIGMCPGPSESKWERIANPIIFRIKKGLEQSGWTVKSLTNHDIQNPENIRKMSIDILYFHWALAVYPIKKYKYFGKSGMIHNKLLNTPIIKKIYRNALDLRYRIHNIIEKKKIVETARSEIQEWANSISDLNVPVIWHQHDLLTHSLKNKKNYLATIDECLHRTLFELSSALVLNEESCKDPVFNFFKGTKKYCVAYIGKLQDEELIPTIEARKRLGLALDEKIFLYSGTARHNRNPASTTRAYKTIHRDHPFTRLIVASRNCKKHLKRPLPSNVKVVDHFLSAEEMRDYFCATDFVVNDAEDYLTSAVVRTAIGYNKPVISQEFGSTVDMSRKALIPIADDQEDGLYQALLQALNLTKEEYSAMVRACIDNDQARTWESSAKNISDLCAELLE